MIVGDLLNFFGGYGNNHSVNFDGVNDYVVAGTNSSFNYYHGATNPTGFAFTIGFWIKLNNRTNPQVFLGTGSGTGTVGLYCSLNSANRSLFCQIARGVVGPTNTVINVSSAANAYPDNANWHYIVWTYDQSLASNNLILYLNNIPVITATKTGLTPSSANSTNPMNFGRLGNNNFLISGNIFNLFFAQGVITSGERAALFANPKANPRQIITSQIVTNAYRFPQGQSDFPTWTDSVGGINGTMTNQTSANIQLDTP